MKNQLHDSLPKPFKTSVGRWMQIAPDKGEGYRLFDPVAEIETGRILFDDKEHWIYDGEILSVVEQEEVAGAITGHQKEMEALLRTLHLEDGER
ncbi:MAG: hypothetical protein C0191_04695 [Mucilaginibacter sp.]|nr:MAG: hypothetical protein C0191_04695 [Mucilaginibacter sp.]HEK22067.1 hypothetical protein [Bacteroidota bacterium]